MPVGLAWRQVRDRFRVAGLATPELDARLIGQAATGLDSMALVRREREPIDAEAAKRLEQFAQRRLVGEPLARIVGEAEFWGLSFGLNDATLVPRPETEMLVAEGIEFLEPRASQRLIDLGTGSGAIAVALLDALPNANAFATDLAPEALAAARLNAQRHGVAGRITFGQGAWWQGVTHTELFDLIVSNPPYIATPDIDMLAPEVRVFDPWLALDGGWDGLEAYRAIAAQAARRLRPGGLALLEIGASQGEIVARMFARAGFARVEVLKDLAGLDRVVRCAHS